ncbi:hypothetical protein JL721_12513 [Aureococcus anophagefferens]|nr:hypothetical protein JL721_12513 [Aureococcus anophagefferens]
MKDQEHIRRAARLHAAVTQEQERNAFLERIQAEEVRREQARIAAARPVPPPPNRATGADDDSDEGWEESDNDDPVEDLIHRERIRERDLLRTPGCLALGRKAFRLEDMPRVTERDREILRRVLYILREAERRNCGELEVPRPREWALSELGDTMTTEAIRARFDLRRDDGVFFCVRLQRLFPNLDFRLSWSVRFNVVVQTIDAIALDSNLELTRVDMEVRRSTVGVYEDSLACQLLGQTYYVHPDKTIKITVDLVVTSEVIGAFPRPRRPSFHALARSFPLAGTAPGRAEVHIKELGFHFVDPLAPIAEKEIVPRVRLHPVPRHRGLDQHHVARPAFSTRPRASFDASRASPDAPMNASVRHGRARAPTPRVIRKFANAIARKAAEARGETFVPTPYDETAVDAVVVTAVPPVAPVVSAPAGPPLKALEGMSTKQLNAELDAAGVPKTGRPKASIEILRDLATLVADGAKKVVFKYQNGKAKAGANGTDYLVARWRGLAETDPLRLEFEELARRDVAAAAADEPVDRLQRVPDPGLVNLPTIWPRMRLPFRVATPRVGEGFFPRQVDVNDMETLRAAGRRMCYRVIRDAKRRVANNSKPRAEDDQCPAYYGVPGLQRTLLRHQRRSRLHVPRGKFLARATIPGSGKHAIIVFGTYDSKVEVSIQEKHRISEVVVARIEEVNVARAEAEKTLPPLHTAASTAAVANFYRAARLLEPLPPRQPRRVAKLYVVPNGEVVSPPPPPIYHVTENGERLLVEMAAAMFDSRPIEIARPLLFESEEDAERRPSRPRQAQAQVAQKKRKVHALFPVSFPPDDPHRSQAAAAAAAAAAAERATRRCPRRRRRGASAAPEAPAEALAEAPPTAPPVEAPAEAPPTAAAPAKKKKKKRSRRAPREPAEISEYGARMRNIAAGNKLLLARPHPPAAGVAPRPSPAAPPP